MSLLVMDFFGDAVLSSCRGWKNNFRYGSTSYGPTVGLTFLMIKKCSITISFYIYIYICCLYRQSYILLGSIKRYIHYAVCLYYICSIIQLCFQASKRFFSVISSLTRIVGSELGVSEREDAKVAYA